MAEDSLPIPDENSTQETKQTDYQWSVYQNEKNNPFTYLLAVEIDSSKNTIEFNLDPITVKTLLQTLTIVQNEQIKFITGEDSQIESLESENTENTIDSQTSDIKIKPTTENQTWLSHHKGLLILAIIIASFVIYSFATGGTKI